MASYNPIYIGYQWSQAFDFPAGFLANYDYARAEFRYDVDDPDPVASVTGGLGAVFDVNRLYITLTKAQTAVLKETEVITSIVLVKNTVETPISIIFTIPVVRLPTEPMA